MWAVDLDRALPTIADGGGWVLVGPLVFKTSVGREERPGCVRFAHASANRLSAVLVRGQATSFHVIPWIPGRGGSSRSVEPGPSALPPPRGCGRQGRFDLAWRTLLARAMPLSCLFSHQTDVGSRRATPHDRGYRRSVPLRAQADRGFDPGDKARAAVRGWGSSHAHVFARVSAVREGRSPCQGLSVNNSC